MQAHSALLKLFVQNPWQSLSIALKKHYIRNVYSVLLQGAWTIAVCIVSSAIHKNKCVESLFVYLHMQQYE